MRLKILLPTKILIDEDVVKVIAEAENGSFCLLPLHIDFVAALIPGLLSFTSIDEKEEFLALDEGILIKRGDEVLVSTRNAILGPDLGKLRKMIIKQQRELEEHEIMIQTALARLEADLVRRFIELGEGAHV
jgi:F-type H+-transporting ATPase subunit epsilon